jgi:predicted DNA binding CopG/RHH family protein
MRDDFPSLEMSLYFHLVKIAFDNEHLQTFTNINVRITTPLLLACHFVKTKGSNEGRLRSHSTKEHVNTIRRNKK